eukprot:3265117-Prymnesium_polylepis.1
MQVAGLLGEEVGGPRLRRLPPERRGLVLLVVRVQAERECGRAGAQLLDGDRATLEAPRDLALREGDVRTAQLQVLLTLALRAVLVHLHRLVRLFQVLGLGLEQ